MKAFKASLWAASAIFVLAAPRFLDRGTLNDLWNLVPADPDFNQHTKRDRIPSLERLHIAEPHLAQTYTLYASTPLLRKALISDTEQRFRSLLPTDTSFAQQVASAAIRLVDNVGIYRNLARF